MRELPRQYQSFSGLTAALLAALALLAACERDPEADLAAGIEAYQERDYEAAYDYWAPHAEAGHLEAQARLALLYSGGLGVEEDAARAVALFTPAAAAGLPLGTYLRALHMMEARGLSKDAVAALDLLQPLIACEMPAALNLGGYALKHRNGVGRDSDLAADWYRMAAQLGYPPAQFNYARHLILEAKGELDGVAEGLSWAHLASENGVDEAKEYLESTADVLIFHDYYSLADAKFQRLSREVHRRDPFKCRPRSR